MEHADMIQKGGLCEGVVELALSNIVSKVRYLRALCIVKKGDYICESVSKINRLSRRP